MTEHIVARKIYLLIGAILLALTFLTWGVATINLGPGNIVVALLIAFSKAALVGLFFMHLRWSASLIVLTAIAGLFWFGILLVLTLSDYVTRF